MVPNPCLKDGRGWWEFLPIRRRYIRRKRSMHLVCLSPEVCASHKRFHLRVLRSSKYPQLVPQRRKKRKQWCQEACQVCQHPFACLVFFFFASNPSKYIKYRLHHSGSTAIHKIAVVPSQGPEMDTEIKQFA